MESIDYQFKDAKPIDTVNRIQDLLARRGISVVEVPGNSGVKNCYSARMTIAGTHFGTNGKGVTPEFSRASGYAEMMERLQSGHLKLHTGALQYKDCICTDREGLLEHCGKWLEEIGSVATTSSGEVLTAEDIIQGILDSSNDGSIRLLPFYDATAQEMTYFPVALIKSIYSTNGLAAGNTLEEALVQSFSEIVERYNREKFLTGDMVPPDVPEDYLKQFPTAYETICDIRAGGYDVYVKDCSLGEPFPLVATVLIDRKTQGYHVHMGANPVFEIALERSLTEMFQGRSLSKIASISSLYMGKKGLRRSPEDIYRIHVVGNISMPIEFFSGTPSYEFRPFPDCRKKDNRTLLCEILDYISKKGKSMLIRDYSHLGFPTVRIIVPGMSESYFDNFSQKNSMIRLGKNSDKVFRDIESASIDDKIASSLFIKQSQAHAVNQGITYSGLCAIPTRIDPQEDNMFGLLHFAYLEWELGNRPQALKIALNSSSMAPQAEKSYLDCLYRVFALAGRDFAQDEALDKLQIFYCEDTIRDVRAVLASKENPFKRFLVRCSPDACPTCRFAEKCYVKDENRIIGILQDAISAFDNAAAFAKIDELFRSL